MLRPVIFLGFAIVGASAEIFEFEETQLPRKDQLLSYYLFHIYASAVPGNASVTFADFSVMRADGSRMGVSPGLQVSLIPWSKFWDLIKEDDDCYSDGRASFVEKAGLPAFNLGLSPVQAGKQVTTFPISVTDEYVLTVTNCGETPSHMLEGAMLKGKVIVAQPHGFLPGSKILTLQWCGWFAMVNAVICIFWTAATARHYKALVYVQKMIAVVAVAAFLEAGMAYAQYKEWNETGIRSTAFVSMTMFFYSMKYVFTLRMLMETAIGSGFAFEKLDRCSEVKLDMVCGVFLLLQWIWKAIISYKYRFMLKPVFLLAITIPGTVLWLIIFGCIYRQFRSLFTELQNKKLASEAVSLFINMRLVLVGSILLATVVLLVQLTDIWLHQTPWNLQWVPYDAAPHSVFTLFLLANMVLWWPHADSWKLAYSDQVNQDENAEAPAGEHRAQAEKIEVEAEQIGAGEEL